MTDDQPTVLIRPSAKTRNITIVVVVVWVAANVLLGVASGTTREWLISAAFILVGVAAGVGSIRQYVAAYPDGRLESLGFELKPRTYERNKIQSFDGRSTTRPGASRTVWAHFHDGSEIALPATAGAPFTKPHLDEHVSALTSWLKAR